MVSHSLLAALLTAFVTADLTVRDVTKAKFIKPRLFSNSLKTKPHNSTLRLSIRGLQPLESLDSIFPGKRQASCDAGYGYCSTSGYCCPSDDGCCVNSCAPSGANCCSNGGSCNEGEDCCHEGCITAGSTCCDNGGICDPGYACCGGNNYGCAPKDAECCSNYGYCDSGYMCVTYDGQPACCPNGDCTGSDSGFFLTSIASNEIGTAPIAAATTSPNSYPSTNDLGSYPTDASFVSELASLSSLFDTIPTLSTALGDLTDFTLPTSDPTGLDGLVSSAEAQLTSLLAEPGVSSIQAGLASTTAASGGSSGSGSNGGSGGGVVSGGRPASAGLQSVHLPALCALVLSAFGVLTVLL